VLTKGAWTVQRLPRPILLVAAALIAAASAAHAEPMTFTFDKAHTEIGFDVVHFFTKVHGRFNEFDGTMVADPENIAASSVQVTIPARSIFTANEKRDAHLQTEDFFWVEEHPDITFKSTKIVPGKDSKHFQVVGDLTMRGVTKPVTLDAELIGAGAITVGGNSFGTRAGFHATATVNRKDFGIVWNKVLDQGGVMVGDEVSITLAVSAKSEDPLPAVAEKQ
jgi:polyisoprenoid-binding protein YceI